MESTSENAWYKVSTGGTATEVDLRSYSRRCFRNMETNARDTNEAQSNGCPRGSGLGVGRKEAGGLPFLTVNYKGSLPVYKADGG